MKNVRSARLWFKEGNSDKVYEVDLTDLETPGSDARFLVNFRYGRRGASLREGTKTNSPVDRAEADKIFDSLVVSRRIPAIGGWIKLLKRKHCRKVRAI